MLDVVYSLVFSSSVFCPFGEGTATGVEGTEEQGKGRGRRKRKAGDRKGSRRRGRKREGSKGRKETKAWRRKRENRWGSLEKGTEAKESKRGGRKEGDRKERVYSGSLIDLQPTTPCVLPAQKSALLLLPLWRTRIFSSAFSASSSDNVAKGDDEPAGRGEDECAGEGDLDLLG